MTAKEEFNAVEWQTLVEGPALGGLIVIASQRGGTIRESVAMAKVYVESEKEHKGHDLLGEIAAKPPKLGAREFSSAEQLRMEGLERIRGAVALLEQKATPDELEAYKRFALTVAQRAAEADKSGGFLGVGGEKVSDSERAALADVAAALGTEPPAAPAE
jgi:hypothetical protein